MLVLKKVHSCCCDKSAVSPLVRGVAVTARMSGWSAVSAKLRRRQRRIKETYCYYFKKKKHVNVTIETQIKEGDQDKGSPGKRFPHFLNWEPFSWLFSLLLPNSLLMCDIYPTISATDYTFVKRLYRQ